MSNMKVRRNWFARFALRSYDMSLWLRKFLAASEQEPFDGLRDIMQCCHENMVAAEVDVLVTPHGSSSDSGVRHRVGRVDELGHFSAYVRTIEEARGVASLIQSDVRDTVLQLRTFQGETVAIALWRRYKRGDGIVHPIHVGTIEIGWQP